MERSEPALYTVDRELCEAWPELSIVPVGGDVGDRERMLAVFRGHRPQVVAHAAAHKHVPLMETNATEAVKNNVIRAYLGAFLPEAQMNGGAPPAA